MIAGFQENLKRLLIDPNDLFHVHVRARIGKKATDHFEGKVKEFILRMPSVVSRIGRMISLEKEGSVVDRLAKYLLIYLYDPMDFLPEKDKGLFGYLDDAYFVAIVYIMILEKSDPSLGSSEDEQTKKWIYTSLESVRYLIPDESRKIDKAVSDIVTNQILCYSAVR
jgi:uncharacterized membrane protein YkvA (DUF1232 family)